MSAESPPVRESSPEGRTWDYVIVGTGIGGGTVGYALAKAGYTVLFLEKGRSPAEPQSLKGAYAESFPEQHDRLSRAGRFSEPIVDRSAPGGKGCVLNPLMGSGVGGSSALYGMVMERFQPIDFTSWPVSHEEISPYYAKAEALYRVRKPTAFDNIYLRTLSDYFRTQGLHPHQNGLANEKGGGECQGYLCATECKHDSGTICIFPAVAQYHAVLLTECDIHHVDIEQARAVGVTGTHQNKPFSVKARTVILAAGALKTPLILQNSSLPHGSGVVGRYLMRHLTELYVLRTLSITPQAADTKGLGLDDFYSHEGRILGTVQTFGQLPPPAVLITQLMQNIKQRHPLLFYCCAPFTSLARLVLRLIVDRRLVVAAIIEDSPVYENRVWSEQGVVHLRYVIAPSDFEKITQMRRILTPLLRPFNPLRISLAENDGSFAHVCGTCRMGRDPKTSVVDETNRVHGVDNLYVVDSSFFPTSGGTGPALTIAANALRVAELLIAS